MDPQALMQLMLAAQSNGGGADSAAVLQQLVASSDDPTARMLGAMLAQQQASVARTDDDDEDEDDVRNRRIEQLTDRLDHAQETLRRVFDDLEVMRGRNQLLAEALGACARCWGGDGSCEVCAGAGRAGSTEPNPALFAKLVVPALRRMADAQKRKGRASKPPRAEESA